MSRLSAIAASWPIDAGPVSEESLKSLMTRIGVRYGRSGSVDPASLPFVSGDTTAGSESELQTVVAGARSDVDLPLTIEESNFFANTKKRIERGDLPKRKLSDLETYLADNPDGVWENSWVVFPQSVLGPDAACVFERDLLADQASLNAGLRKDRSKFFVSRQGGECIRVPVSYLLKLALVEAVSHFPSGAMSLRQAGERLLSHFQNDNTSPETSSLYVIAAKAEGSAGRGISREMSLRYLLTQLLAQYANDRFSLRQRGQDVQVFLSPHPPIRQRGLSLCVSDSFYRDLFMNPCLSGWTRGEEKHEYMHLCHQVLSRSQFNAALKLREAGIITSNLITLPNLSNISLANNGTHVSLGSLKLSGLLKDSTSAFTRHHEKYLGDLVVKIVEHFLPLFVGTFTAAPYRMAFEDFHPEKALGFLPHELDFTHLRMLWRRWRKKADLSVLGNPITPFGPPMIDKFISKLFHLKGDFISDYRLIDYLVALLSTDRSPALNGALGNSLPLKQDLSDLGIFDTRMSVYLFEKLREFDAMGFSGFEARHYSLFESFDEDMDPAVNLQNLLYLLAYKYIASGEIGHDGIPDNPVVESERRQVVFGSAIGIPTFFVDKKTPNRLMAKILARTQRLRLSSRYPGYTRVYNREYRLALLETLRRDAADLIDMMGMEETLLDLEYRLREPDIYGTTGKLTRGILSGEGARSAMQMDAGGFNRKAEDYYRTALRRRHTEEALDHLEEGLMRLERNTMPHQSGLRAGLAAIIGRISVQSYVASVKNDLLGDRASRRDLEKLIALVVLQTQAASDAHRKFQNITQEEVA